MPTPYVNRRAFSLLVFAFLAVATHPLSGQGVAIGSLAVSVVDDHGSAVAEATVSLERGGAAIRSAATLRNGTVTISFLTPGRYAVLAEQFGYQPVRMREVEIVGGGVTHIIIRVTRRPPPITTVEEQASNAVISGAERGRAVTGRELTMFDRRTEINGLTQYFSEADAPRDGRDGALASGNGLPPRFSNLFVDGVHESMIRHPGIPGEPVGSYLFSRQDIDQFGFTGFGPNGSGPGSLGSVITAGTRQAGEKFSFRPWAMVSSAKLGGNKLDNAGDSTGTSIQAGVRLGGSLKGDTASWSLSGNFQRLQQPTASPFDATRATADTSADLNAAVAAAALSHGSTDVSSWLAPTVRTWTGGSGAGRLDWRFGATTLFALRAAGASWTEKNPLTGDELVNGAGAALKGHDISSAASLTTGAQDWTSETRLGFRSATRDWTGASLPYTGIVGDAMALGGAATLAGNFKESGLNFSESFSYRSGPHAFMAGVSLDHEASTYDWIPGSAGVYQFGDVAGFAAGTGSFYQSVRSAVAPSIGTSYFSVFLQDEWRATPQLQVTGGLRLDYEALPAAIISPNAAWLRISGVPNDSQPSDRRQHDLGPRASIAWDVNGSGQTIVRAAAALMPGQFDRVALAEAAQFDGDVSVRRATGLLAWPATGTGGAAVVGQALTLFGDSVRKPQSFKSEVSIAQHIGNGTTLTVSGAYRHADYMLQRRDLNAVGGASATAADGRPIFGTLEQYGSLLVPKVGSNRRFGEFDMVYALTPTGYNDYYEASVVLDHRMLRGLDLTVGYTYSKTTDNLPGSLSADPADQLSPFPAGLDGARWEDGRSDLDIPHRLSATALYTTAGNFSIGARFRYRSGLPFTPGFRRGVDANGDGSGANDPAFLGAAVSGMSTVVSANSCLGGQSGLAARNSCRDPGMSALDLRASLPIHGGWAITVDAFNVVGSEVGLFDHAALLVDPHGTITTDASGHTVLPVIANPGFGNLLSRRGDPRTIRIGFRVEN